MRKLKLYIDTSIFNFAFAEDAPKEKDITLRLFDEVREGIYEVYISEDDAFHIAIASVNGLDAIISWNFNHIVKLKTKREVVGINILMGYKEIDIFSPWEVVESERT